MSKGNMSKEPLLDYRLLTPGRRLGIQRSADARRGTPTGFALLDQEKRREMAQLGGLSASEAGTAHHFTCDEARAAAYKSVEAKRRKKQQLEEDRLNALAVFNVWK